MNLLTGAIQDRWGSREEQRKNRKEINCLACHSAKACNAWNLSSVSSIVGCGEGNVGNRGGTTPLAMSMSRRVGRREAAPKIWSLRMSSMSMGEAGRCGAGVNGTSGT